MNPVFSSQTPQTDALHPQLLRLLLPDLCLICHHLFHENKRSGHEHRGGGTFPPALQSGLASVSSPSNTRTQLKSLHMPADPFPPSQGGGMASGCPSCGAAKRNLTQSHVSRTIPWMALPKEQDLPVQGITRRPAGLGEKTPAYLHFAEGKAVQGKRPPPHDVPGPSPGTVAPAVGPTTPGFFPYLSLPSFP